VFSKAGFPLGKPTDVPKPRHPLLKYNTGQDFSNLNYILEQCSETGVPAPGSEAYREFL
jgi:hypothetical protein